MRHDGRRHLQVSTADLIRQRFYQATARACPGLTADIKEGAPVKRRDRAMAERATPEDIRPDLAQAATGDEDLPKHPMVCRSRERIGSQPPEMNGASHEVAGARIQQRPSEGCKDQRPRQHQFNAGHDEASLPGFGVVGHDSFRIRNEKAANAMVNCRHRATLAVAIIP